MAVRKLYTCKDREEKGESCLLTTTAWCPRHCRHRSQSSNPSGSTIGLPHLRVKRGARIRLDSLLNVIDIIDISSAAELISTNRTVADSLNVTVSVLTQLPTTANTAFKVDLNANTIMIDATSRIDVAARGFLL